MFKSIGHRSKASSCVITNFLLLTIVSIVPGDILAEEEPPTMVITPSRYEQDIKQVGSSISVISKEEIEEKKLQNLGDLLRTVEGVQVIQSGGAGGISSVFVRGSSSSQVLVMIDSVPINEVNSGLFDFADLSTLAIERIEILRGPQSVVYGSAALGGVINIITSKGKDENRATIQMEGGSYGTQKYLANGNFSKDEVSGSLGASFFNTHNISQAAAVNGNSEHDPYQNVTLNGSTTYRPDSVSKISGSIRYTNGKSQLDNFDFAQGAIDALDYKQDKELYQSSIVGETEIGIWSPKLILGYNQENYKARDPETEFNNYQLKSNTTSVQQQNLFKINQYFSSLVGYSYTQNDGNSVGSFDKSRYVNSFFVEEFINPFDSTNISVGARYDDDSTFGDATTYRASLSQEIIELNSRLHTSYGTGFRAPSFSDLYFPNFSNPNLDAEKSRGFDVGVGSDFKYFSTDVTYFETTYSNLINFNNTTYLPENIGRARTRGIESKVNFELSKTMDLTLKYTYLDAKNITDDSLLARRGRHQGGIMISNRMIEKLTLRSDILLIADRVDSSGANMDDYVTVGGTAQYDVTDSLHPYIRVQNAFDNNYQEIPGYGTLGASIFAGISYNL